MDIQLIASGSRPWEKAMGYWGVSYLVDGDILFDTFCSQLFLSRKLRKASVNLKTLSSVVLSHEHWDHVGGLWGVLSERPGIKVYAPTGAAESLRQRIVAEGGGLIDSPEQKELKKNVLLSEAMEGLFRRKAIPEHFLFLKTAKGVVILTGCSHPGILNIVKKAKDVFHAPVYGVMGGLHLLRDREDEICLCAKALQKEGVQMVAPTHCTGERAEKIFKDVFGQDFIDLREGQTLSL